MNIDINNFNNTTDEITIKEIIKEILLYLEKINEKNKELKELKDDIQEEYAMIKGFRKKNGDVDKNAIKMSELISAAKYIFEKNQNFEIKISNYETYKTDILNGEENCPVNKIKKYLDKEKEIKDLRKEILEFEKEVTTNEKFNISGKTFKFIFNTLKNEFKRNKEKNKNIDNLENKELEEKIKNLFYEVLKENK